MTLLINAMEMQGTIVEKKYQIKNYNYESDNAVSRNMLRQ